MIFFLTKEEIVLMGKGEPNTSFVSKSFRYDLQTKNITQFGNWLSNHNATQLATQISN